MNISGCTNSCGQHHIADIGFFGLERRSHGRAAPGYQMLLGGHVGQLAIEFGAKAVKVPAKTASDAVVRVVGRFAGERQAGESFPDWLARAGGAAAVGEGLARPRRLPRPGRGTRLLRRLRRDRPLRGGGRPRRVRDVTEHDLPDLRELAAVSATLERQPATAAIEWAAERFGDGLVLASSFQDCVLIDLVAQVAPGARGGVPRHPVPLRGDTLVRRDGAAPLRPAAAGRRARHRARRPLARRPRRVLRGPQGRPDGEGARRPGGVDDRAAPRRGPDPGPRPRSSATTSGGAW